MHSGDPVLRDSSILRPNLRLQLQDSRTPCFPPHRVALETPDPSRSNCANSRGAALDVTTITREPWRDSTAASTYAWQGANRRSDRASATHEVHNERYNGEDDQDVNHGIGNVKHRDAKEPGDQQNNSDNCKHFRALHCDQRNRTKGSMFFANRLLRTRRAREPTVMPPPP